MAKTTIGNFHTLGMSILERIKAVHLPAMLKPLVAAFARINAEYEAAVKKSGTARGARDEALRIVGEADDVLDASISKLADMMVYAGFGARTNPFRGYSSYAPGKLVDLAYASEVRETKALLAKVGKRKPGAPEVTRAIAACAKAAAAVEVALQKFDRVEAEFDRVRGQRDSLLPGWIKAHAKLKRHAAVAWDEDVATYKSVFAPLTAIERPVRGAARRKKKSIASAHAPASATAATPVPASTTSPAPATEPRPKPDSEQS